MKQNFQKKGECSTQFFMYFKNGSEGLLMNFATEKINFWKYREGKFLTFDT